MSTTELGWMWRSCRAGARPRVTRRALQVQRWSGERAAGL